jgi:D-beta-D-heptose 7-phosphate kinase/D-beta-D-heptose 1-phosphate adenosyltransferase
MASHLQSQLKNRLSEPQTIALIYHDIFDFPLRKHELYKWMPGDLLKLRRGRPQVYEVDNHVVFRGRENTIKTRLMREQISKEKSKILSSCKHYFEENDNILLVAITGSLAMASASRKSDIDLMMVTRAGTMWKSRLSTLLKLKRHKEAVRNAGNSDEADKLCINIWMDETDLLIGKENRNAYTAHELAQIVPLINREHTYEKLLAENDWILNYWPNAVEIKKGAKIELPKGGKGLSEWGAYKFQKAYMSRKITREVVTPTRAFFHPTDWSGRVVGELTRRGVVHV